jgi:hypothetical protein
VFPNQKSKMLSGGPLKPGFGLSGAIQQSELENQKCGGPLKPGFGLSGATQQSKIEN